MYLSHVQGIETQMKELSQSMRRIAMHLIEKQRRQLLQGGIGSTEIHGSSASKLNIVEVLLAQDGDDKLSDDAMTAVIFVSFFYNHTTLQYNSLSL
jgi:hypothetical protein